MEKSGRTILGRYAVGAEIATGPLSNLYEGWDTTIERRVAIKSITLAETHDTEGSQQRIRSRREAQAAGRLQHPHLVAIFDYGESSECAYIVTEYVEGTTLKAALDKGVRFSSFRVCQLVADILSGLQYSHSRGVVHGDIKPSNIIVSTDGRAKIADFGGRGFGHSEAMRTGFILGSPAYMSPEQLRGETVGPRTDIYSVGAILFELLTGEQPFTGEPATIVHKALTTDPPKPSDILDTVPRAFDGLVARAMARHSDQRFGDAKDFAQALGEALTVIRASHPTQVTDPPAIEKPPRRPASRSKIFVAGGVLFSTAAAMGVVATYWGSTQVHAPIVTEALRQSLPLPSSLPVARSQDVGQAAVPVQPVPSPGAPVPPEMKIPFDPQRLASGDMLDRIAPPTMSSGQTLAVPPDLPKVAAVDQPDLVPQVELPSKADQPVPAISPPLALGAAAVAPLPADSPPPAQIFGEGSNPQRPAPAAHRDDHASAPRALAKKARVAAPDAPLTYKEIVALSRTEKQVSRPLDAAIGPVPTVRKTEAATPAHATDVGSTSVSAGSLGRYEIVNGLRVFVPTPELAANNSTIVQADRQPTGHVSNNAASAAPLATATRFVGSSPAQGGVSPPLNVLGRYEIVDGVRRYVSVSPDGN